MEDINLDTNTQSIERDPNRKLNLEDFAKEVDVSYQTIYRYVKSGKLVPRRTLGGKPYFLTGDVETFKCHYSSEPLILDGAPINGTAE